MEIIHLILGKANPERMNGVNKVVYQLASRQADSGRNVAVWGITKDTTHNYGKRNFETQLFQAYKNPFALDEQLKKALLSKKGKAVIHLHGGWIPTYAAIGSFLINNNIPYVITPHGAYNTIAMKRSSWIKKIFFRLFENKLLKGAQKIHSLGESEINGLQKIFPNNKSFLLPYGFDVTNEITRQKQLDKEFIIGFIGRLDIYTKGLDILLEAFRRFQILKPNSKLWIIGDSNERPQLEQMIVQNKMEHKAILFGSKFGNEKNELLQKMNVFVHPSRNEGLPVAVLEAAAMGIPAVVTKATNIATHIKQYQAGIAIDDEDTEALSNAFVNLYELWEKGELTKLEKNAQKMVHEAFDWKHIINEFDKLYHII